MFKVPEQHRVKKGAVGTDPSYGNNGAFIVDRGRTKFFIIASDGDLWEHVSVHCQNDGKERTPTWAEMCYIKGLFWDETDRVVQYHPPKSEYVNTHPHTLHLWRYTLQPFPHPDKIMV